MRPEDSETAQPETESPELDSQDTASAAGHAADVDHAFEGELETPEPAVAPKSDNQRVLEAEKEALQARAEMENFRKRMQRESELQLKYANMPLVRDLLEVTDNLQRALDAADPEDQATKGLRDGVDMVRQQMADTLAKYGCKPIEALGVEFDPNVHEAISQMPSEEYASGTVMNEVAVGYVLHDRVVRPSHVIVSTGSPSNS